MEEIYTLLSKHFLDETTNKEERRIAEFKNDNAEEYLILSKLWGSDLKIVVKDYDTEAALKIVTSKYNQKQSVVRDLFPIAVKWLSIAAVLLVSILAVNHFFEGNVVQPEQIVQTGDATQNKEIFLSDSSRVWLNDGAVLEYPTQFVGEERNVFLRGEAYFDIKKDKDKPFVVKTVHGNVTVLGTTFNLNAGDSLSQVWLTTGQVKMSSNYRDEHIVIQPGSSAAVSHEKMTTGPSEPNYMSWKTGCFKFDNVPLSDVVKDLLAFYPENIVVNESAANKLLTGTFEVLAIEEILELIEVSCQVSIIKTDNFITIN